MTSRERVRTALSHREPDRVPIFEIVINNTVAEHYLGRKSYVWGTGSTTKAQLEAEMQGKKEYRAFMDTCFQDALKVYHDAGLDMIPVYPTAFVTPLNFGLCNVATAEIYDIEIVKENDNFFRLVSQDPKAPGFWCTCMFSPESDTFQMYSDNIKEKGEREFEKYVDYLEKKDLTKVPEALQHGLDALEHAIAVNNDRYRLFLLGFADIEYPCFNTFHALFLELMCTNPQLVHRYMRVTTESMKVMLRIELEMEVDGILGANDWCYRSGPMMSPGQFDEFLAPYLKELIDLTHSYKKPYIRHLDGNTYPILNSLVSYCGIDAYHAIEPPAGMEIEEVKRLYGDRISVVGNIDCGDILTNRSPAEIRKEVGRIIGAVSPGGGHIFGSSNAIHGGISLENFMAYIQAAKDYGVYPIDIRENTER